MTDEKDESTMTPAIGGGADEVTRQVLAKFMGDISEDGRLSISPRASKRRLYPSTQHYNTAFSNTW
jgi:hypothetical protein